jgi:hypothetical protein
MIPVAAVPAGLAAGVLAWFVAGGANAGGARLGAVAEQLDGLRAPRPAAAAPPMADIAGLSANPLFALTTGPGARPQPVVRVDGLVRARGRVAALVSVDDKPADWLRLGDTRDGVTLIEVQGSGVVVDTLYGPQNVGLGERSPAAAAAAVTTSTPAAQTAAAVDTIPQGFRSPVPPADAPRLR